MRTSTILFAAIALGVTVLGSGFVAQKSVNYIEQTTTKMLRTALTASGNEWVTFETSGLRVSIYGEAPSEQARFRVLETLNQLIAHNRIDDQMRVRVVNAVQAPDFSLEILRNLDRISLIGLVPEELGRDAILSDIGSIRGGTKITDMMESADWAVPKHWPESLDFAGELLVRLPRSKISVTPGSVHVSATADDDRQKQALEEELADARPIGVALTYTISAPRPVISPFSVAMVLDNGRAEMQRCAADSEAGSAKILGAAAALGIVSTCQLGLGAPSSDWADAVSASIRALGALGGGRLDITNIDVSLTANVGTDQDLYDATISRLRSQLPRIYSLTDRLPLLPVEEIANQDDLSARFTAYLSADGEVQLLGALHNEMTKMATTTFAEAKFGADHVADGTTLSADLPEQWPSRVLAGIEALSMMKSGRLDITKTAVTVEGEVATIEERDAVDALLAQKLASQTELRTRITISAVPSSAEFPATPEDSARRINQILAATQISFEPSSAEIAAESQPVIDEIAKILDSLPGARFEVGGHTDSQGGDEVNLALSQARAEAVVDALLDRGLDLIYLTAWGYGKSVPIGDNETEEGRALNRRIEFKLLTDLPPAVEDEVTEDAAAPEGEETAPEGAEAATEGTEAAPEDAVDAADGPETDTAEPEATPGPSAAEAEATPDTPAATDAAAPAEVPIIPAAPADDGEAPSEVEETNG